MPDLSIGQAPNLASVNCYALFSTNGAVTNTGISVIKGDIGTDSGTASGFTSSSVVGSVHTVPDASTVASAADLNSVYTYLNSLSHDIELPFPASFGHNLVLTPHIYLLNSATTLTDTLYIDGEGNAAAIFVIQVNGILSAVNNSQMILINGAQAKNVFWKVEGNVNIHEGAVFSGTIVANNSDIHINSGALLNGRALATNGAIITSSMSVIAAVMPFAGAITGSGRVFIGGSTALLSSGITGGAWRTSNSSVLVTGGIVTGVLAGTDTIMYIVANSCGADTATKVVTVNGVSAVCVGSVLNLTDSAPGGSWASSNANASVSGGVVTGVIVGQDTIRYISGNSCGTDTASIIITINPLPDAGSISGSSTVLTGTAITLTDTVAGGTWVSSITSIATVGSTGVVTGIAPGTDTISYSITNSCGIAIVRKIITVYILPNAGVIAGPANVCVGSVVTLTDTTTGGIWSSSNSTASVTGAGVVTGITAGIDTIIYTVTSDYGTAIASKIITINPMPDAGTISGVPSVCVGAAITLTESVTGGTWSSTSTIATVSAGAVTGISAGVDTIKYAVTNMCGTATTSQIITVNPLPSVGSITGAALVLAGATITMANAVSGGVWGSISPSIATISSSGVVTGITPGTDTITYTVVNSCGMAVTRKVITVYLLPYAGIITGPSSVCAGSNITLADTATGGTWSSSNGRATISSTGIVTGVIAGNDTIFYTVTSTYGTATATKSVTVNAQPLLTSTVTPAAVCDSAVFSYVTLSDTTSAVFSWFRPVIPGISNSVASGTGNVSEALVNTTANSIAVTYIYTVTANGCSSTSNVAVIINPIPRLAGILFDTICSGTLFNYVATGLTSGTTFTWSRTSVAGILPASSTGTVNITEVLTSSLNTPVNVDYAFTLTANGCSFQQNVVVTVNPLPASPAITTMAPSPLCAGTMYQNFGAGQPPAIGTIYQWSAINAVIWATGHNGQNAVVNFPNSGIAQIILSANIVGSPCQITDAYSVIVGDAVNIFPSIFYFQYHFVCLPSNLDSYQWGYDDVTTLDSTKLPGEINQDYINASPDYANKYYWVNTSYNGCTQKTYYNAPLALENVNSEGVTSLNLFPNPASELLNVTINSAITDGLQIEVFNMTGQKLSSTLVVNHKATFDVAQFSSGTYLVACYKGGLKIASARFIKN